jgi:LysR family transcriptional regulator, transcriptional activator of the cysJI operon
LNYMKLNILVLIEKYKKVTDVAIRLGLKQPTVTFHMKSLENELGTPLFQYRSGRVLLTEAGKILYTYAIKIVSLTEEAERNVKQISSLSQGQLVLEASFIPGTYLLPRIAASFLKEFPETNLSLSIQSDSILRERLRAQDIPLAFMHIEDTNDESLNYQLIAADETVLIYPPDHPLESNPNLTPEEIASFPWIQHAEGSALRSFADHWARLNNVHPWNRVETDSPDTFKEMVRQGSAVGVFSKRGIEPELALGRLRCTPLPGIMPGNGRFMLAWRKDYTLSPLQQTFVEYCTSAGIEE